MSADGSPALRAAMDRLGAAVALGKQHIKSVRLHRLTEELRAALKNEVRWCERNADNCLPERQLLAAIERYTDGDLS